MLGYSPCEHRAVYLTAEKQLYCHVTLLTNQEPPLLVPPPTLMSIKQM